MINPAIFSTLQIAGRTYRLQDVTRNADGSQSWLVSRTGTGTVYTVSVAPDGSFGSVCFAY